MDGTLNRVKMDMELYFCYNLGKDIHMSEKDHKMFMRILYVFARHNIQPSAAIKILDELNAVLTEQEE